MSAINISYLQEWVGKSQCLSDEISLFPARAMAAALDNEQLPEKGDKLPVFWEWLYFLDTPKAAATGADGHPSKGGFLPPVPLPRRMWAAGEAQRMQPLSIGQSAERQSTISSVELKEGSSGVLVFVTVEHETYQQGQLCIHQKQDIVYREEPSPNAPLPPVKAPPENPDWHKTITPDPVLLFRYSALTFNGHRIHYDRTYATQQEFYPALVVHGPLLVTLLFELQRQQAPDIVVKQFKFRAVRPTFDSHPFQVQGKLNGGQLKLWSVDKDNALCMQIDAAVSSPDS